MTDKESFRNWKWYGTALGVGDLLGSTQCTFGTAFMLAWHDAAMRKCEVMLTEAEGIYAVRLDGGGLIEMETGPTWAEFEAMALTKEISLILPESEGRNRNVAREMGTYLFDLRKLAGMTQGQVGQLAGVSASSIGRFERGVAIKEPAVRKILETVGRLAVMDRGAALNRPRLRVAESETDEREQSRLWKISEVIDRAFEEKMGEFLRQPGEVVLMPKPKGWLRRLWGLVVGE